MLGIQRYGKEVIVNPCVLYSLCTVCVSAVVQAQEVYRRDWLCWTISQTLSLHCTHPHTHPHPHPPIHTLPLSVSLALLSPGGAQAAEVYRRDWFVLDHVSLRAANNMESTLSSASVGEWRCV
jgi:hypothetical protein